MKVFAFKMEDEQARELEDYCHKAGKTSSEIIRGFVLSGLHGSPQPTPQPAPKPAPRPAPQPAPSGPAYPPPLVEVVGGLRKGRYIINAFRDTQRWKYWLPKALPIAFIIWALLIPNALISPRAALPLLVLLIIDALWKNRVFHHEVAELGSRQIWDLIEELPDLWAKECAARGPDLALAEILAHIKDRRQHLGELGVKDLGLRPWNPES